MRVLITADSVGGVWTYVLELIRALPFVEFTLAAMGARLTHDQQHETGELPNLRVVMSEYKLEWMADPWSDVEAAGRWLIDLEREIRPDVVHLNQFAFGALPWNSPVLLVGHSDVVSWWQAVHGTAPPVEWDHYRSIVRRGLAGASVVAAPTASALEDLERHHGPFTTAAVVHNGVDPRRFTSGEKQELIFAAGRIWDEAKNVTALAELAGALPWQVVIAGNAEHPDGRRFPASGAQLVGRIPPVDVAAYMQRAAIYALPARYEPFGLSVLEAGLSGCALVLGDIPSLREIWGAAALYVQPDDRKSLEAVLTRLIEDGEMRTELGAKARARALQYSSAAMASGYMRIYERSVARTAAERESRCAS